MGLDGIVESYLPVTKDRETFAIYPKKTRSVFYCSMYIQGSLCSGRTGNKKSGNGRTGNYQYEDEDVQGFTIKNTGSSSAKLIRTIVYTRTEDTKNILLTEEVSESRKEVQV